MVAQRLKTNDSKAVRRGDEAGRATFKYITVCGSGLSLTSIPVESCDAAIGATELAEQDKGSTDRQSSRAGGCLKKKTTLYEEA